MHIGIFFRKTVKDLDQACINKNCCVSSDQELNPPQGQTAAKISKHREDAEGPPTLGQTVTGALLVLYTPCWFCFA